MSLPLLVEKFLGVHFLDANDEDAFEEMSMTWSEFVAPLLHVEMEREKFTNLKLNLRSHASMLSFLLAGQTEVTYPPFRRTKFEVRNGYKEAMGSL